MLNTLRALNRYAGGPVVAWMVATQIGKSERMARVYLARLERAGYVRRPAGERNGWLAA